jgi:hypothetical protein
MLEPQPVGVRTYVLKAEQVGRVTITPQHRSNGLFSGMQVPLVGWMREAEEADAVWITSGGQGTPSRAALRRGRERVGEKGAAVRQAVEARRTHGRHTMATEVAPEIVARDHKNVRSGVRASVCRRVGHRTVILDATWGRSR